MSLPPKATNSPRPQAREANDDILRLRAALDVALTTLNSSSQNVEGGTQPASAPTTQRDTILPMSERAAGSMTARETPTIMKKPPSEGESSQASVQANNISSTLGVLSHNQGNFGGSSAAEERVRELEQHVLRKGLEELETSKKQLELENRNANLEKQVKEYELKLSEALPLLEDLDRNRSELKDLRWKLTHRTEEVDDLKKETMRMKEEMVACEEHGMHAEKARVELEKQLESEREEALWLSEVEARQMREMEAKCEELQAQLANQEPERQSARETEERLQRRIRELEEKSPVASAREAHLKDCMAQLVSNNEAMEREVRELRAELAESVQPYSSTKMSMRSPERSTMATTQVIA